MPSQEIIHPHEIIDAIPSMIFTVGHDFTVLQANKKFCNELSSQSGQPITQEDIVGHNLFEFIQENKPFSHQFIQAVRQVNQTHQEVKFQHQALFDPSKTWGWTITPKLSGDNSQYLDLIFNGADITQKLENEKNLKEMATRDKVTGLFNRQFATEIIKNLESSREPSATTFIDLDHFKLINDQYGHGFGDKYLQDTAGFLLTCFRESDFVCRWGGDEFLVIMPDFSSDPDFVQIKQEEIDSKLANLNASRQEMDLPDIKFTFKTSVAEPVYGLNDNHKEVIVGHQVSKAIKDADKMLIKAKNARSEDISYPHTFGKFPTSDSIIE